MCSNASIFNVVNPDSSTQISITSLNAACIPVSLTSAALVVDPVSGSERLIINGSFGSNVLAEDLVVRVAVPLASSSLPQVYFSNVTVEADGSISCVPPNISVTQYADTCHLPLFVELKNANPDYSPYGGESTGDVIAMKQEPCQEQTSYCQEPSLFNGAALLNFGEEPGVNILSKSTCDFFLQHQIPQ